jgi:hypothetical protein
MLVEEIYRQFSHEKSRHPEKQSPKFIYLGENQYMELMQTANEHRAAINVFKERKEVFDMQIFCVDARDHMQIL